MGSRTGQAYGLGTAGRTVRDAEGSRSRSDGGRSEEHDNGAGGAGADGTTAVVVLNKVAGIAAGYGETRDGQCRGTGVCQGHSQGGTGHRHRLIGEREASGREADGVRTACSIPSEAHDLGCRWRRQRR